MIDPELGFTSDVIRDPNRFVGRTGLIRDCIKALNAPLGLLAIYGKRGVGKSSLLRQVQQLALGDYALAKHAGLQHEIPARPRTYLTVFYACDGMISDGRDLLRRLCNDQDPEDGLLRLVPNDGKELQEFQRTREMQGGADLKVVNWGIKGVESSKYARVVEGDDVQTFRNFSGAIVQHVVEKRMKRDALLILLDEFDVLKNKEGLGSLIKSLSSASVKFGLSGIGQDLSDLVQDHASVERLLEQGAIHVTPMSSHETIEIIERAESLFEGKVRFESSVKEKIAQMSNGYPYFTQLLGKECVHKSNEKNANGVISEDLFGDVLSDIESGNSFPTLEAAYRRAIGDSEGRQILLHLLAEQYTSDGGLGRVYLKEVRTDAEGLEVQHIDQLIPRLIDSNYGPVLTRVPEKQGVYEFVNPVFQQYVRLRKL